VEAKVRRRQGGVCRDGEAASNHGHETSVTQEVLRRCSHVVGQGVGTVVVGQRRPLLVIRCSVLSSVSETRDQLFRCVSVGS
jgi:hypothetical protein